MEPLTFSRRRFLGASLAGAAWMTGVAEVLSHAAAPPARGARSIIMLWLGGGASQLETFDPHPGKAIAGGTGAVKSAVKGVQLAEGMPLVAQEMESIALVRSMASKEGDHERGTYTMKTGFRPDPTVVHPSIGAILCYKLPVAGAEIPRHVSILPNQWSARGGYLGDQYDSFRTGDPSQPVPDTQANIPTWRDQQRMKSLDVVERAFAKGRQRRVDSTLHKETMERARKLMSSEQLKAFDVSGEPLKVRKAYGDTPFGRACLAARRLTEKGVRCVEVTLNGFDTHVNNHSLHKPLVSNLDVALSALVRDLRERKTLDQTLVIVASEFGRTPRINPASGRDHWPTGFSVALAGGGVKGGTVVGATDPEGKEKNPSDPVTVGDLYATVLTAVGIDFAELNQTKIGRTVPFAEDKSKVVKQLLRG
jgi:uncharacterized protein (DUF1501 family)